MSWAAGIDFDEGRLGRIHIYGLKSRDEAISWHKESTTHERWWWLKPSGWIKEIKP